MSRLPDSVTISKDVSRALNISLPIVALESTVITHGLPHPQNFELARDIERAIRDEGATPATIGILDGHIYVGLSSNQLERLANEEEVYKVGPRDFARAYKDGASGGTTVAGTMHVCKQVGIKVFATGGIGGVHRESHFDVSADLQALATIPMIVVCAGAKAILDLPATLEYLETMGVPVVGFGTKEFPAFYSRKSGLDVSATYETPQDIVSFAHAHWEMGFQSAILVANPIPIAGEISKSEMDSYIEQASKEAQKEKIHGQELTPFLLKHINELTRGRSMRANLSLLLNNARLAAQIAGALAASQRHRTA